jgi:hypothetical protein
MFEAASSSLELMKNKTNYLIVSITSFNEYGEGSQIEESVPYQSNSHRYEDYLPNNPDFYMQKTKEWINLLNLINSTKI